MKRLTAWIGGALGGIAAYRWLRGRPRAEAAPSPEPSQSEPDERAEELRAKLAESRESDEPSPVEPGEPEKEVEERRQRVYEEGRATLDDMKSE